MWLENVECKDFIREASTELNGSDVQVDIYVKLERCRIRLIQLSKEKFGSNQAEIRRANEQL